MTQQPFILRFAGTVEYTLQRKRVKNINLRVRPDGSVTVSANRMVPLTQVDAFVESKAEWIARAKQRMAQQVNAMKDNSVDSLSTEECRQYLAEICRLVFPLFKGLLKEQPELKVKSLKSCWGVCHPHRGYITLNRTLVGKPRAAVEYVVAHEYAHFLHPNHKREFYTLLGSIMPDYKERKALLK